MGKFTKLLLLTLIMAMLAGFATVGVAASETTGEGVAETELTVPVVYDGMSARTRLDYPGLRSLYTVDLETVAKWEAAGYTVEYGAIMAVGTLGGVNYNTVDGLTVTKMEEGGFSTANLGGAVVCVYSSDPNATYDTGLYTSQTETEASFAYTGTFRPAQQTSEYYNIGFVYSAFFAATNEDGETTIEYVRPTAEDNFFTTGGECTLFEVSEYWVESGNANYAQNKNLLNVVRTQYKDSYSESYDDAETPDTVETKTIAAGGSYTITLPKMKAGIYAVTLNGTSAASNGGYVSVRTPLSGSTQRPSLTGEKDESGAYIIDSSKAVVHVVLKDGDNTVDLKAQQALVLNSITITLSEEIKLEDTVMYSTKIDGKDGVTAPVEEEAVALSTDENGLNRYLRVQAAQNFNTAAFTFKGMAAGKYRVALLYAAGAAESYKVGLTLGSSTLSGTLSENATGSSGAGAGYAELGTLEFEEGTNTLYFNRVGGNYVTIANVLLIRETYTVTVTDYSGKVVSKQEVYGGECAVLPTMPALPEGYVSTGDEIVESIPVTGDVTFTQNAKLTEAAPTPTDNTVTLSGATAGYYRLALTASVAADGKVYATNGDGNVYEAAMTAGGTEVSMLVWLNNGDNTLTLSADDGMELSVTASTLTNEIPAYMAIRLNGTNANLSLSGDEVTFADVKVTIGGYYRLYTVGASTAALTVSVDGNAAYTATAAGSGSLLPTFAAIKLEAGTYTVALAADAAATLDALVLEPHFDKHVWKDEYTVDTPNSCSEDGTQSYHCGICDVSDGNVEVLPADPNVHNMVIDEENSIPASYKKDGKTVTVCTGDCGTVEEEVVPRLYYSFDEAKSGNTITYTIDNVEETGLYEFRYVGSAPTSGYGVFYGKLGDKYASFNRHQSGTDADGYATTRYYVWLVAGEENTITWKHSSSASFTSARLDYVAGNDTTQYYNWDGILELVDGETVTSAQYISKGEHSFDGGLGTYVRVSGSSSGIQTRNGCIQLRESDAVKYTVTVAEDGEYSMSILTSNNVFNITMTDADGNVYDFSGDPTTAASAIAGSESAYYYESTKTNWLAAGEYTLSVCLGSGSSNGVVSTLYLTKLEHTHTYGDYTVDVPPTCNTAGMQSLYCTMCGEKGESAEVPATGIHTGEWVVVSDITATTDGAMKQTCADCGEVTYKTMKSPYNQTANVTVGTVSDGKVTVTTDVTGWYEIEVLGNGSSSYFKLYNETFGSNVYTYQKGTNAATAGFGAYLIAGENTLVFNGTFTGVNANLIAAHGAVTDYATTSNGVKDNTGSGSCSFGTVTVETDGWYYVGMTMAVIFDNTVTVTLTNGENVVPIEESLTASSYMLPVNGSTDSLGYHEFGYVYLTAGDYTADVTNTAHFHAGTILLYAVDTEAHVCSTFEEEVTVKPTCNGEGVLTKTCAVCGVATTTPIEATGVHAGEWVITAPTATENGTAVKNCDGCGIEMGNKTLLATGTADDITVTEFVGSGTSEVTFTVNAAVAGWYEVTLTGPSSTNYFELYNETFDATVNTTQKETGGTTGYGVYLKAGDNDLVYKSKSTATTTVTEAKLTLVYAGDYVDYDVSGWESLALSTSSVTYEFTVESAGFYMIGGTSKLQDAGSSMDLAIASGDTTVKLNNTFTDALITANGSSTEAIGYDNHGIVYLEAGTYTVTVTNPKAISSGNTTSNVCRVYTGSLFVYAITAEDVSE